MKLFVYTFCIVFVLFIEENGALEQNFDELKLQVEQLMEYRKEDLMKSELLKAERNEDRRRMETLSFAVENFHEIVDKLIEEKQQNEEQIKELSDTVEQILQDKVKDRKVINDLQKQVNSYMKDGGNGSIQDGGDRRIQSEKQGNQLDENDGKSLDDSSEEIMDIKIGKLLNDEDRKLLSDTLGKIHGEGYGKTQKNSEQRKHDGGKGITSGQQTYHQVSISIH